ncbi:MAG: PilZ domain-containing protein [Deltaproteobacteria bacterium]|nr:PilZ domain-containing protein [Deltaproteobacteria bacterium]
MAKKKTEHPAPAPASDLELKISRKFGRIKVSCSAVLAFPARNAHPRVKARLIQIGKGGCGIATDERLYIGEECLVWATGGGHKYLGVQGQVVWMKSIYDGHETSIVGIRFTKSIELTAELLRYLGAKDEATADEA